MEIIESGGNHKIGVGDVVKLFKRSPELGVHGLEEFDVLLERDKLDKNIETFSQDAENIVIRLNPRREEVLC